MSRHVVCGGVWAGVKIHRLSPIVTGIPRDVNGRYSVKISVFLKYERSSQPALLLRKHTEV